MTQPSKNSPDCQTLRELIPAYSIGATDPDETALVERLLPECPEAAAELDQYLALAETLPYTVSQAKPPADLHDKLMAAASAPKVASAPPRPAPSIASRPTAKPRATSAAAVARPAIAPRQAAASRSRILPLALGAAAAVAAALLIISNIYWVNQVNDLHQQQQALVSLLRDQRDALASLGTGRSHSLQLVSTDTTQSGSSLATVLWNPSSSTALLYTDHLPQLSPDKSYQVWLIGDANPVSAGVFHVDDQGVGVLVIQADAPIDDYGTVAISTEPAGGSEQPTTTPIAAAQI